MGREVCEGKRDMGDEWKRGRENREGKRERDRDRGRGRKGQSGPPTRAPVSGSV